MGTIWYFFSKETQEYSMNILTGAGEGYEPQSFYVEYVKDVQDYEAVIAVAYYSLTTLSTIGYGDLHPKSDIERVMASIIMIVGVVVFTFIMDSFNQIVHTLKRAYEENGDPPDLVRWFKILKRFKKGKQLDPDLREEIE